MPNHAKKQRKKAIHDIWNARICGVEKLNKLIREAFALSSFMLRAFFQNRGVGKDSAIGVLRRVNHHFRRDLISRCARNVQVDVNC